MKSTLLALFVTLLLAAPAFAQHNLTTGARCPYLDDCVIGDENVDSITLQTTSGSLDVQGDSANQLLFKVDGTGVVIFKGADTTGDADTRYDTSTSGNIDLGSADVASVDIITAGDVTLKAADVILPATETATFGAPNAFFDTPANLNQYVGIPRLNVTQLGAALADGTGTTELITPLAATCAHTNGSEADDAVLFITDAASYKYTGATTAADDDGFDCTITGHANQATVSIGFWFRSDTALTAGTLDVTLLDAASAEANENMPAITVVDEWQWIEVDVTTDCATDCADLDGFSINVTTAGAATSEMDGTIIHIDSGAIWLTTGEEAIGDVQVGGVISVSAAADAAGTGNTPSQLVEYTDYIVNYQTGADALVIITNQSANYGWTLEVLND